MPGNSLETSKITYCNNFIRNKVASYLENQVFAEKHMTNKQLENITVMLLKILMESGYDNNDAILVLIETGKMLEDRND